MNPRTALGILALLFFGGLIALACGCQSRAVVVRPARPYVPVQPVAPVIVPVRPLVPVVPVIVPRPIIRPVVPVIVPVRPYCPRCPKVAPKPAPRAPRHGVWYPSKIILRSITYPLRRNAPKNPVAPWRWAKAARDRSRRPF